MDYEKLYESLKTIKEYCAKSDCNTCPMSVGENPYKCMLADNEYGKYPKDWKLKEPIYKAFEGYE